MVLQRSMVDIFNLSLSQFLIVKMKISKLASWELQEKTETGLIFNAASIQMLFDENLPDVQMVSDQFLDFFFYKMIIFIIWLFYVLL